MILQAQRRQHFLHCEDRSPYTGFPTDSESELRLYTELLIEGMESGRYAYIAHPDLINFIGDRQVYDEQMKRVCRYLKSRNIPVEINMLGVREGRHYTSEHFLEIAKECGNSVIIGCDAHYPEALDDRENLAKCLALAEKYSLPVVDFLTGLE